MPSIMSTLMSQSEIKDLGDRAFEEITAVYSLLTPDQMAAVQADTAPGDADSLAERLALRGRLSYTQARYCRLNFVTPAELSQGDWLTVEEARTDCRVFGSIADNRGLIEESIELNLLPLYHSERGIVLRRTEFEDWHDKMDGRLKATRPASVQYGFAWVRDEAA